MQVIERFDIYKDGEYVAFPNLAWIDEDTLACFFRHAWDRRKEYGTYTHIDATAKDVYVTSQDGRHFKPAMHTVVDDDMSEQDPCVTVLADGRIIMTCFRWQIVPEGQGEGIWGKALFQRYGRTRKGAYDTFNIGFSCSISDDGGQSWKHYPVVQPEGYVTSAVRGNITELPDGSLLMPFYGAKTIGALSSCGVVRSQDRGESWQLLGEMACEEGINFLEPNLYRTPSGRLIGLMRTQTDYMVPGVKFEDTYLNLHIAVSEDDGKTFGPVQEVSSVWGSNPVHVLALRSGKAFVNYGYRRAPFGIRAKLCNAELSDIESVPELVVCDDAPNGDLGYSHAVQLKDDTILLAYYISDPDGTRKIEGALIKE